MTSSRISFLVFMLLCIAGFCALGTWQIKRLHWKEGLIAQIDAAYAHDVKPPFIKPDQIRSLQPDHFLRAMFRGHLDFGHAFQLEGQIDNEQQSSHIIVPYIISSDLTILVDFGPGFVAHDKNNSSTVLTGLLRRVPASNKFTPDNNPDTKTWFALDRGDLGIKNLQPYELLPEHTPWKEYPVRKPELRNEHLNYAIFWFAMAVITLLLTAYYIFRRTE